MQIIPSMAVTCSICANDITFVKPDKIADIIGLTCTKCGRRRIYARDDIHAPSRETIAQNAASRHQADAGSRQR